MKTGCPAASSAVAAFEELAGAGADAERGFHMDPDGNGNMTTGVKTANGVK